MRDRRSAHRSAGIQENDEVASKRLDLRIPARRNHPEHAECRGTEECSRARLSYRQGQSHLGLGNRPADDDIAVQRRTASIVQADHRAPHVAGCADRMRGGLDSASLGNRVLDRDRQEQARGERSFRHLDGDAFGVCDAPGLPLVARRHRRGEAPLPGALVQPGKALVDADLHLDRGPRRDVSELLSEEARTILREQRRAAAVHERLFVALAGSRATVDLADDTALANPEREAADRAVRREGEQVAHGERIVERVHEPLLQNDASEPTPRLDGEPRLLERQNPTLQTYEPTASTFVNRLRLNRHCFLPIP